MEQREHFVLWELIMRNLSNRFCFLEVKVLAVQNVPLDGKEGYKSGHGCFKVFCPGPSLEREDNALGEGWETMPWAGWALGEESLAPRLRVCSLGTLLLVLQWLCSCCTPSGTTWLWKVLEVYQEEIKNSLKWLHSPWTYGLCAGWIAVCMHNKFNALGACQTPCMCYAAFAPFMSVRKTGD